MEENYLSKATEVGPVARLDMQNKIDSLARHPDKTGSKQHRVLSFDPGQRNALNKEPLPKKKDHQYRQQDQ